MKPFLKAWARGVSIFAFFFCLSIVVAVLGFVAEVLPPVVSVPVCIVFGPPGFIGCLDGLLRICFQRSVRGGDAGSIEVPDEKSIASPRACRRPGLRAAVCRCSYVRGA